MMQLVTNIINNGGTIVPLSITDAPEVVGYGKPNPLNPSVVCRGDDIIVNIRMCNYTYLPHGMSKTPVFCLYGDHAFSYNHIGVMNDGEVVGHNIIMNEGSHRLFGIYTGTEDMRLVEWDNDIYGVCARPDIVNNSVIQQLIHFDKGLNPIGSWFLGTGCNMEKNWLPITDRPFTFLHNPNNGTTISIDINDLLPASSNEINHIDVPKFSGNMSGSTQLIRWKDGYINICHRRINYTDPNEYTYIYYEHYFVGYDNNLNVQWIGPTFHFLSPSIEYCCGLAMDEHNVYISFSLYDACAFLATIPLEYFDKMMDTEYTPISVPDFFNKYIDGFKGNDRATASLVPRICK